jgi:predicted RNase H-like HicB family nuclease
MISRSLALSILVAFILLLGVTSAACTAETVEVTRIKVLERRVIERVIVTVEVTRLHRVVETPKPTAADIVPPALSATPELTATTSTGTPAPTPSKSSSTTPVPTVPSTQRLGESLLAALQNTEQALLSLVQALNSDPIPVDAAIESYHALGSAPTLTVPEGETQLESLYARYREQVETTLGQGNDLYTHLVQIQAGEATQTEVSPIHLALAQDAASASTSTLQALIRELEAYLASQP